MKEEFHIDISADMEGGMETMCTYGESIYYNAWNKAEKKGRKQGEKKGLKEGAKQTTLRFIRNLMESMGWSA